MRPYSQDLREKIIRALEEQEETQDEIAERLAVSGSFVAKLWRRWRETGSGAALKHAGGRARSLQADEALLRHELECQPMSRWPSCLREWRLSVRPSSLERRCARSCAASPCRAKKVAPPL